jgi:iron complex outermembrane receptor protein
MKRLLLLLCLSQPALAQVSGKLTSADGVPIPFANVLLLKDSTLIKATLTDETGKYLIDGIQPGEYLLRFSCIGYQTWDSTLSASTGDLGTHILYPKLLGEVVVRAEKPLFQQQPDGMIVNVENSILTKGSTALAVLERSPGVVIDSRNYNITLNGKSGVMVMLNGKIIRLSVEQVLTLLNSLPADNIEKIELLTTPPAKYDAEGNAGMINIVLKKNKLAGTNGSVSLSAGYGKGEKASGSVNLSHNMLYGAYSYSHDRSYGSFAGQGTQKLPDMAFDFLSIGKSVANNHRVTIGIDVPLSPAITIGGSVNYSNNHSDNKRFNRGYYTLVPDSFFQMNADIKGFNRWRNLTTSAYIKGKQFSIDLDYLNYNNHNPTNVLSSFLDKNGHDAGELFEPRHIGYANTSIQVGVIKIDYVKQLSPHVKLETGLKGTYTSSISISGIENTASNNIHFKEGIGAFYASFNILTNFTIGARYEYSKSHNLFPNISYTKKLNEQSEIQLSYSKRISRPSYNDLASYIAYNDPFSVFTGNPSLKPAITHNLKFGYNYLNYSFSLLLSNDDHPIVQSQLVTGPLKNIVYISPQNLSWQRNLSFQANLPFKINDWWNMSYSLTGGWQRFKIDYTVSPVSKTYFNYSLNFSESFKLPKNYALELSGWYSSKSYYGTIKNDSRGVVNAGVKKGNFQLAVNDVFRTSHFDTYFGRLTKEVFDGKNHVGVNPESSFFPIIKLTYSRTFGGGYNEKKREGAKDERERIRS